MKIISYLLSSIYMLVFGLLLVIFHPIQWIFLKLGGHNGHQRSVNALQISLMYCHAILGTRYRLRNQYKLAKDKPVIIVSNHQSMNDVPPLIWMFRKHYPRFISKKELGKGIPSISFSLRQTGAALIDRKNQKQSIAEIIRFAKLIYNNNYAGIIFPEGTRSRTGIPKPFKTRGLEVLFKYIPNAQIIPVTINNSWKTTKYGKFPLGLGAKITIDAHPPILLSDYPKATYQELIAQLEKVITSHIVVA
ncbi:1-acyl-sn-glycerol-3-phosphate acyltransferase [Kordia sp. SMS9]|uniref:lysophospholipid acyltransferase family protein n=1 Tax=Kordia sp. SMS9 TaxID=2282170 RepID=UPI000E0DFD35|nr:lysophospholipid acyltransferase family protein [Kordia sp. SMS9]AXG69138.1 1-acyl-sn-glycerol-3-phosphate acyltransferase [Kordia sp. SMS9]